MEGNCTRYSWAYYYPTCLLRNLFKTEISKKMLSMTTTLFKIQIKYLDFYKDLGLSFLFLDLVGGPNALLELPTNFGTVIVGCLFASIFFPMILSSIHLAVNYWKILSKFIKKGSTRPTRCLRTMFFCLMSCVLYCVLFTHIVKLKVQIA